MPPAKFYAIIGTGSVLTVTDTENNPYAISKVYKSAHGDSSGRTYNCIVENNSWGTPGGPSIGANKVIVVVDAYDKSPEVIQPELIDWLEAQGFTIPIE